MIIKIQEVIIIKYDKKIFKILFLSLPRVVYDRNLHDRCTDFGETAQYVINKYKNNKNIKLDIFDGSIPVATLKTIYKLFLNKYDLVVFYTDITDAPIVLKLAKILSYISPESHNFIYGDGTLSIKQFFLREPFDAIHISGDQEASLCSYIDFLINKNKDDLKGVAVRLEEKFYFNYEDIRIPATEWAFPPIDLLAIDEYKKFAKEYKNSKYACSVYVSKGCVKRCKYCLCCSREGFEDRRRPIIQLIDFLEKNKSNFELFKLHSADFLYDRAWVVEFCNEIIKRKLKIKWKCTVCFDSMDEDIIKLCSEAGCIGMGFGIETFYENKDNGLKLSVSKFEEVMIDLSKYPIKFKGFIMIGVENQTIQDINFTINLLKKHNVKVRPSTYTPFHLLNNKSQKELDEINLEMWNKKECFKIVNKEIQESDIYKILLDF